jgi:cytochrome d ubiquinol oxidase subunit II
VAIGNILEGVPFWFDLSLRAFYTATLMQLLNPFALGCGVVSVLMLTLHGGIYLVNKLESNLGWRVYRFIYLAGAGFIVAYALAGYYLLHSVRGYQVASTLAQDGPSNPLYKQVITGVGLWWHNYTVMPSLMLIPALGFVGAVLAMGLVYAKWLKMAWWLSAVMVMAVVASVGVTLFPFILPSSLQPSMSLLVFDASSSRLTLLIMLIATAVFMPIILLYTSWVYHVMRGKVSVDSNTHY